jgi:hypothetical protein
MIEINSLEDVYGGSSSLSSAAAAHSLAVTSGPVHDQPPSPPGVLWHTHTKSYPWNRLCRLSGVKRVLCYGAEELDPGDRYRAGDNISSVQAGATLVCQFTSGAIM